ncbi:MAG TPA: thiamine pyrophosphate-binding protein, partial [Elusimicrobiota bacterium]|nr:thiamine pyrophosphate-binding protein [Elusimicrobiota bacterium]
MKVKVSDVIADFLVKKGMKHTFGIIGSGNAHIFDSIYRTTAIQMVCVHHEQAACMALQTYYRTSGTVTAAVLTTGAGSTNGITGVVSAWADSIPGMIIVSNENSKFTRPESPLRMWGVQGYDSVDMVKKVTKYAVRVADPLKILYELEKTYALAVSGRPGPCWIEIPMNVQSAVVEDSELTRFDPREIEIRRDMVQLQKLADRVRDEISKSSRPLVWLGYGIRIAGALDLLKEMLEKVRLPYLISWAGVDMVDSDHPLLYGRAGVYGQRAANFVLQNCDYLLTIGTRLAIPQVGYDISELARDAKIAVVDVDQSELDKYKERFDLPICADAGDFLRCFMKSVSAKPVPSPTEWLSTCTGYRQKYPWVGPEHADKDGYINSYRFMEKLDRHFKPDQVVTTDMGTALLCAFQVLRIHDGQRLMTSTGLGEMG